MWEWQSVLVYVTVAVALGYLVRRFVWPASGTSKKNGAGGDCGSPDCGCR